RGARVRRGRARGGERRGHGYRDRRGDAPGDLRSVRPSGVEPRSVAGRHGRGAVARQDGCRVDAAIDAERGPEPFLDAEPDAAIGDVGLPIIDGYALARRVRAALGDRVRLIARTGYGQPSDLERALEAGFDEHLAKPADLGRIDRVLDELLAAKP